MKKFFKEFEAFALRGNVMDLAVGVIIGGAFQNIVNSLVNDIITPLLNLVVLTEFNDLTLTIGTASVKYGQFITNVINFILMAFVIFLIVKGLNKLGGLGNKKDEKPVVYICPYCRSVVDKQATRCPDCTAEMNPTPKK